MIAKPPQAPAGFILLRPLGSGGMGEVFLARRGPSERPVALKFLHETEAARVESLREEVRLLAQLSHPRLVRVLDFFPEGPCFAMEYVEGLPLDQALPQLPPERWAELLGQLCQGLHYLHARHFLHRDLKPSNLMVDASGNLKILDFGLAARREPLGKLAAPRGTLGYLAPEAWAGEVGVGTDLFAAGAACYEAITGQTPYSASGNLAAAFRKAPRPIRELRPDCPEFLANLLHRMIDADPARRPGSARTALNYLNQYLPTPLPLLDEAAAGTVLTHLPLMGRDEEMQRAWRTLSENFEPAASPTLVLTGPTGIGRSRLLRELLWKLRLADRSVRVLAPSVDIAWWKALFPGAASLPGHWLGLGAADWQALRDSRAVAVVEDLHLWQTAAREELPSFIALARRKAPGLRWILEYDELLLAAPPALEGPSEDNHDAVNLRLGPLSQGAALSLLTAADSENRLKERQRLQIAEGAGGNPWLLLESLRQAFEPGAGKRGFPGSMAEAQAARLRTLTPAAQRLLAQIATAEHPPSWEMLRRLSAGTELSPARLELLEKNWLGGKGSDSGEPSLAQASLLPLLKQILPEALRREADAAWLRYWTGREAAPRSCPEAVAVVGHALATDARETALAWGIPAATFLVGQGRNAEAADLLQKLWPLAGTAEQRYLIQGHLAPVLHRLGRLPESLQAYERWIQDRPDDESRLQRAKYHFYTGMVRFGMEDKAEAKRRFEACLATADARVHPAHRPYQARARNFLAALAQETGDFAAARLHLAAAAELASGDELLLGEVAQRSGELARRALDYEAALGRMDAALEHYRRAQNPQAAAVALQWSGMLRRELGELEPAEEKLNEALRLSEQSGNVLQWARFRHNAALIQLDRGCYGEALAGMDEAEPILKLLGTPGDRGLAKLHRAEVWARLGREVDPGIQAAIATEPALAAEAARCRGESAYFQLDFEAAESEFREALAAARSAHDTVQALAAALGLCRCRAQIQAGGPPPQAWSEWRDQAARIPGPLHELWREVLDLVFRDFEPPPDAAEWTRLWERISGVAFGETRAELWQLLTRALQRVGLKAAAERTFRAALDEQRRLLQNLPEELKMDFEKKRKVQTLDEALAAALPAAPAPTAPPPAAASPSGPLLSEQRFRQFTEISRQISKRHETKEILERVMDAAIEITGAERGFLLLRDVAAKAETLAGFSVKTARHLSHSSLQQEDFKISLSAVRQAMDQGSTLLTENAQLDPRLQEKKSVVQFQLKSILVVPLELEGSVKGAIYLDHRYHPGCFGEEDIVYLNALASQAALALEKAEMLEELRRAKAALEEKVETQERRIETLSDELAQMRDQLRYGYEEIVGQSPAMMEVFHLLDHVTETQIPVWIFGESGSGKELIARSLHFNSSRKGKPFLAVNCSAIPENLLESELFGHKKGAFTHADRDRVGLFEQADGGTLFLDEVADMSPGMQVKLLRVLQEGEVRPLGAAKSVKIDVRLVTASNKNLETLVAEEKFRQDLFFRINGLTLRLPPLRERREDIPLLVSHLIEKIARDFKLAPSEVTDEAYETLVSYNWPGNIRQLEAVLRNALLFAKGRPLTPAFLNLGKPAAEADQPGAAASEKEIRGEERRLIVEALRKTKMDKPAAAEELGISLRSLYMRMERHRIPKNKAVLAKFLGLKKTG